MLISSRHICIMSIVTYGRWELILVRWKKEFCLTSDYTSYNEVLSSYSFLSSSARERRNGFTCWIIWQVFANEFASFSIDFPLLSPEQDTSITSLSVFFCHERTHLCLTPQTAVLACYHRQRAHVHHVTYQLQFRQKTKKWKPKVF